MPKIYLRGLSTTVMLARRLLKIMAEMAPDVNQKLSLAEQAVFWGLFTAVRLFVDESPFPGDDEDPSTPA